MHTFPKFIFCPLLLALMVICLLSSRAYSQESGTGIDSELVSAIDKALSTPAFRGGFQGILIQYLSDGSPLYSRNADKVFLPASNNKLLTGCAAMNLLGPDFTYRTRLRYTGKLLNNGTLKGDLILQGGGDPVLSLKDLDELAKKAAEGGLRRITGRLLYDSSQFDKEYLAEGWNGDDEPFYYSAQVTGLNINENVVKVEVMPGDHIRASPRITVTPANNILLISNKSLTGEAKSNSDIHISRSRGKNVIEIIGSIPLDMPAAKAAHEDITFEDPPHFAAQMMLEALKRAGIKISGKDSSEIKATVSNLPILAEHLSPAMPELLKLMNKPSDNLMAECFIKTIGAQLKSKGSWENGIVAAREWFSSIGMDISLLHQIDGSGLSRKNYVSPRNLVRLLSYMSYRPTFQAYYDSLAIAGVDGTLLYFGQNTPAAGNVRAKDGYLGYVSALTGFVTTRQGEKVVFSILMNNHLVKNTECRAAQSKIVNLLIDYKRRSVP